MITTMLWKEYREQRLAVVALFATTIGLLVGVHTFSLPGDIDTALSTIMVVALAWFVGLVAGAQSFATEVENRTRGWLITLPVRYQYICLTKTFVAGLIAIIHAMLLMHIALAMRWLDAKQYGELLLYCIGFSLSGVCCGLWGSAQAKTALGAVGWSMAYQIIVFILSFIIGMTISQAIFQAWLFFLGIYEKNYDVQSLLYDIKEWTNTVFIPLQFTLICITAPLYFALRRASTRSGQRQLAQSKRQIDGRWRWSLFWLTWRQTRYVFWGIVIVGPLIVIPLHLTLMHYLWPPIGLLFGIVAGVGTFAPDHAGEAYRFVGERRLSIRRFWRAKLGMRFLCAMIPVLCFMTIGMIDAAAYGWEVIRYVFINVWGEIDALLLLGPLYGFALGQFLGLVCRKSAVAFILAVFGGCAIVFLWWPSILITGLHVWQWIWPPLILIAATRWAMWPWVCGRLNTRGVCIGLTAAAFLALGSIAGGLWSRVAEVPYESEPFNVAAYEAQLPNFDENEARRRIMPLLESAPFPITPIPPDAILPNRVFRSENDFQELIKAVKECRWKNHDKVLNQCLDEFTSELWLGQLQAAVTAPMGMLQHPMKRLGPMDLSNLLAAKATRAGFVLGGRALQQAQRGELAAAFDSAFVALALSRHLRSKATATMYQTGVNIELSILPILPEIAKKAANQPELIEKALAKLQKHNDEVPGIADTLRLEYLKMMNWVEAPYLAGRGRTFEDTYLLPIAWQMPLEQWRGKRLLAKYFGDFLRLCDLSFIDAQKRRNQTWNRFGLHSERFDLRTPLLAINDVPANGALPNINEMIKQSFVQPLMMASPSYLLNDAYCSRTVRIGTQLQLALMLYQTRHGTVPDTLGVLVPGILPKMPLDPYSGQNFRYRVSGGEQIRLMDRFHLKIEWDTKEVRRGQAVVWSVGPDLVDQGGNFGMQSIEGRGLHCDIVFIVP